MSNALLITDAGLAALVNAENNGTLPVIVSHIGFGSGKYTPTKNATALMTPIKNVTAVSGGAVGEHVIHVTAEDATSDVYDVFEVGVFLEDGTLFAVTSQATPILEKAADSIAMLSVDITLADFSAASVAVGDTNFFNPPATTETKGVVELATNGETINGTDNTRAVTPASLQSKTATAGRIGLVRYATDAEVLAAKIGTATLTPTNLLAAFVKKHGPSGFQRLPNGLILQWGRALIANGQTGTTVLFPSSFPTKCTAVLPSSLGNVGVNYTTDEPELGAVTIKHNGNGGVLTQWIAVGY